MINPLIKLLGTEYRLKTYYDHLENIMIIEVTDSIGKRAHRAFSLLEAELSEHDMLLFTVEQCILMIKGKFYDERTR